MTYETAGAIVIVAGFASGCLAWQIRRRVALESLRRHHEIGSAVFLQMGVVFAVLLAFVFNEVWSEYNTAAEAIVREASDLRIAALLAGNLPTDAQESIKGLISAYLSSVINDEWPMMKRGHDSRLAENRLRQLALGVTQLPMNDPDNIETRRQIATLIQSAEQYRETRLYQMTENLQPVLWFMLLTFSATLVGFLFFFGIDNVWSQVTFTGVFAAALALLLVILNMLDLPFQGALELSPAPFQLAYERLAELM